MTFFTIASVQVSLLAWCPLSETIFEEDHALEESTRMVHRIDTIFVQREANYESISHQMTRIQESNLRYTLLARYWHSPPGASSKEQGRYFLEVQQISELLVAEGAGRISRRRGHA